MFSREQTIQDTEFIGLFSKIQPKSQMQRRARDPTMCPHARDPKNLAEGLGPMAMFVTSPAEGLESTAMSSMNSTGGLEPMTKSHASLYQAFALGRLKIQQ